MFRSSLIALVGLAAACSSSRRAVEPSLVVGRAADAIKLDPARITDNESAEVCEQIYEHLVRMRAGGGAEPELAVAWERSEGDTTWTFHLRPHVLFHDGTPLDADAVVFSLARQLDPSHPAHLADFAWGDLFRDILRVEKVDLLTVRFVLRTPYAPFLANLSMFPMSIVSPSAARAHGPAAFESQPVGTGPFRFVEWKRGERITLAANADYWGGAPRIAHLAFVTVADPRQRLVKLEGGAIDVAENLAPQDLQFVALHPDVRQLRVAAQNIAYLAMNTKRPPFDDVRVRRAISLAIDKEAIVKFVYQGLGVVAGGPLPPSMWAASSRPRPRDVAAARRLLAEAGWRPDVLRPQLHVPPSRTYLPAPVRVARMIAYDLHEIGFDIDVVTHDMDEHLRVLRQGEHDLALLGWTADNGDPDNILYTLFHSRNAERGVARNISFITEPELDDLLDRAQVTLDRSQRELLYARAQAFVADAVPLIPLAHSSIVVAYRYGVRGLELPPTSTLYFDHAALERP